jgi:hypothetical protein
MGPAFPSMRAAAALGAAYEYMYGGSIESVSFQFCEFGLQTNFACVLSYIMIFFATRGRSPGQFFASATWCEFANFTK